MTRSPHPPGDTCLLAGTFDSLTQAAGGRCGQGLLAGGVFEGERMGVGGTL